MSFQSAHKLFGQHRYEEALAAYLEHARSVPEDAATAYAYAARCSSHINVLQEPKQVAPGVRLVHKDDTAGVQKYCRMALALDPNQYLALKLLADALPEESAERLDALERAAAIRPDPLVLLHLGDFYRSVAKDFDRAHATYARLVEAHPKDRTGYEKLSDLCRRNGRPDEATSWSERWKEADARRRNRQH